MAEAMEMEAVEPPKCDVGWANFVARHVQIHARTVSQALLWRDMEECREVVLEFLDGYLLWLDESRRNSFKQSFYVSTTYVSGVTADVVDVDQLSASERKRRHKTFVYTTCRPASGDEARKNLEAYLVLWRSLYSLCETGAHAANRVAQLFDWEVANGGPVWRLAREFAFVSGASLASPVARFPTLDAGFFASLGVCIVEGDVAEFYQDGLKALEARKLNLDDLHEVSDFRIKEASREVSIPPRVSATRLRKTFYEPEGVKAAMVAFRNYFPILHFNVYLTLAAWAWFDPSQVTAATMVLADGVASVLSLLLEMISRAAVYPCRSLCSPSLPLWSLLFTVLSYLIGLGECGLWFLATKMKILPAALSQWILLAALGAAVVIRALHNLLLFFRFPALRKGHHKYRTTSFSHLHRLMWKNLLFFLVTSAILVPLFYWFVVPTLSRSAFWKFCDSPVLVTKIQCYIGIIGLWIPLLSVILIMDFIAFAIVLSFYGAYLAQSNAVGVQSEEATSVIGGFRAFSKLIARWSLKAPLPFMPASPGNSDSTMDDKSPAPKDKDRSSKRKSKKSKKSSASSSSASTDTNVPSTGGKSDGNSSVVVSMPASGKSKGKESSKGTWTYSGDLSSMMTLWYLIVDDLVDMDLISKEMAKSLYVALNWQDVKVGAKPKEIVQFFFASLSSFSPSLLDALPEHYLQKLPPLTQLIPSYGEAAIFDLAYLCNRERKPLSNIEFLVRKYPKEWEYFFQRMKAAYSGGVQVACYGTAVAAAARANFPSFAPSVATLARHATYSFPDTAEEMLVWFLQAGAKMYSPSQETSGENLHPDLLDEIRLWASLRGQTLYKTIRGTLSYRMALSHMYDVAQFGAQMATQKCQVILAHQQYGDPSMLKQIANDIILIYKKLSCPNMAGAALYGDSPFDLVFDWSPRDLVAQDSFRRKLSQQQNEEIIRRYALKSIFTETERICSFGEALKRLIDAKAGACPIGSSGGHNTTTSFPFASIMAGLPNATRILGTSWLFKYKGSNAAAEFLRHGSGELNGRHADSSDSMFGLGSSSQGFHSSDDEDYAASSSSSSHMGDSSASGTSYKRGKRPKAEVFKWDLVACGSTVIHAPMVDDKAITVVDDTPGWLRCYHTETGRELDFLLRRSCFDVHSISFIKVPLKSFQKSSAPFSSDLASGNGLEILSASSSASRDTGEASTSTKSGASSSSMVDTTMVGARVYAVMQFCVRSLETRPERCELFSIVTCLNGESSIEMFEKSNFEASLEESSGSPLSNVDALRATETVCLQRALTRQAKFPVVHRIDVDKLTTRGKRILESVEALREVAADFASDAALWPEASSIPRADDIFLGIEVKYVMPRRNALIMRVAGELPFGDADRIQGKAANQMNGLRFAFGLIVQTKDANQGGNVAEALKFPIVLSKFGIHLARDRADQLKHLKRWTKRNLSGDEKDVMLKAIGSVGSSSDESGEISAKLGKLSGSVKFNKDWLLERGGDVNESPIELMERSIQMGDAYERDGSKVLLAPSIIGFRESVFTRGHGAVARFQAYAEWAFGTIVQRVLSKMGLRMHYGHPDFFNASWIFSRSSMSKANPVYNLSEDIFAGYMALLNERRSIHTDKIQDEKGRDTSLASTYTFTAKLAQGAASQMKSRDVFGMHTRLDFVRLFLLFHSSLGYYFVTTAMLSSVRMYLFGLLVFSLAGYSAENLGNLQFIYSVPFLVQVGMFTLLPLVLEVGVEEGVWSVLKVLIDLPLSLGYFLFQGQTTSHHLMESFAKGKSHYEATGRLLGLSRKSLVDTYQLYGRSHLEPALDYLFYVVVYYIVSSSRFGGYLPLFAPIICVIVFIIAPTGFQLGASLKHIFNDVGEFGRWVFSTESFGALLTEWCAGPVREQMIKNLTWKATFKSTHTRLQTYTIFNNLKSVMSTHWRVDFATAVAQLVRTIVWGFIVVSVPGSMKDSVLKVLIGFFLYLLLVAAIAANTPHTKTKKGCMHSFSNLFYVLSMAYFVALFVILGAWRYLGDCAVGVFLSVKVLKSLSWTVFHVYALFAKMWTSSRWKSIDEDYAKGVAAEKEGKDKKNKVTAEERDKRTKQLKMDLEKHIIGGLFVVEAVDRPVMMVAISCVLIPIHTLWSLFWAIPGLSHFLLYSISLKPDAKLEEMNAARSNQARLMNAIAGFGGAGAGGFNTLANPEDYNELPSFDFGDEEVYEDNY